MRFAFYWIDAFADRPFAGNPAGVVPLEAWPEAALMQQLAFEHGLAETAFFVRTGDARFHLRWFTPAVEVDLCGHATLASAHVIFHELGQTGDTITFDTRSGELTVTRRADGKLELDFPARPATQIAPDSAVVRAIGLEPLWMGRTKNGWLCLYPTAGDVLALRPDHPALQKIVPGRFMVTAPGTDCDFVSRYFAPDAGIPEDPVTGSAHCTLVPFWAERLGKTVLHARQVSARGGELWCELVSAAEGERVRMAGNSTLYMRGEIQV